MSYRNLTESRPGAGGGRIRIALLMLLLTACASTAHQGAGPVAGEPEQHPDTPAAPAPAGINTFSVPVLQEPPATPVSTARAFFDEARLLIDEAQTAFDNEGYGTCEFRLSQALEVLLTADELVPTRIQLDTELPITEEETVRHEAMQRLRGEFERLWNDANALYDRTLPHLNVTTFAVGGLESGEEVDIAAMNAALEEASEPAPGSWEEIRDLIMTMYEQGEIDIDMGLDEWSDYAWKTVYWSVSYYTGRGRNNFKIWLERSGRYRDMVEEALVAENLPRDMVFLCMIESGFSPRAFSRARAVGPWQFMYYTAGKFGLKTYRTHYCLDERRDFEKSTHAAANYLTELHAEFGTWPLAMAAYNSGEGRVRGAQRWARNSRRAQDYWTIYQRLPRETRNYVPYYMAALLISKDPARYGFADLEWQTPFHELYEVVHVDGPITLEAAARYTGVSESLLIELNPELWYKFTPREGYDLRIPRGTTDAFITANEQMPEQGRLSYLTHVIRRNDTGEEIARRYGLSWGTIKEHNRDRVRSDYNLRVGTELRIPRYEQSRYLTEDEIASLTRQRTLAGAGTPVYHTVQRGDTISDIATRYRVTWTQIRQWNNIRGDLIYPGQRLRLYGTSAAASRPAVALASVPSNGIYTVGRRDTLWDISQKFRITVGDLKRWNNLRSNTIYVGQKLIVTRAAAEAAGVAGSEDGTQTARTGN